MQDLGIILKPTEAIMTTTNIAVIIPCYNEAATITRVIEGFRTSLPDARIYVFDNNSSDDTIKRATKAGAQVSRVSLQGKGNVIRRMFADVEADIYILTDGDDTYDASQARALVNQLLNEGLDMLVGIRESSEDQAYRFGHRFGNRLLTRFAGFIFGTSFSDMLSGYRVFSRRYVKSFPAQSSGFETETELSIHALELRMPVAEVVTEYKARPEGSISKLNTYSDGLKILLTIFRLFKLEKPLAFFSLGFAFCALLSLGLALPIFQTYLQTGLVPRYPTAILCSALMLFGLILLTCGIVLNTVTRGRTETKRLFYLMYPPPGNETEK